jgi:hypothetical protein
MLQLRRLPLSDVWSDSKPLYYSGGLGGPTGNRMDGPALEETRRI